MRSSVSSTPHLPVAEPATRNAGPQQTLQQCLARAARVGRSDRDGLYWLDRKERETHCSWQVLADRAARAGATLQRAGVVPGDRVALCIPTEPSFGDALLGCYAAGAVPVPLYPPVRLGRMDEWVEKTARMLQVADCTALIASKRVRRVLGQVLARARPRWGVLHSEELCGEDTAPLHDAHPDDLALVQFSSGTTVAPKPVGLTHRQVLANVEAILDFMPADAPYAHMGVSWLPLYHDMGLIGCVFVALHRPGPLVLLPPEAFLARPALWLRAVARYGGTVSPAPNFAYALCTERIRDEELEGCDLSSLRLALNGAEPISPSVLDAFSARFARWGLRKTALTPVYGLSEVALAATFSDPAVPARSRRLDRAALAQGLAVDADEGAAATELVEVGRPLRGYAVEIRDDGGATVADNTVGTVWVSGPSVMRGYLDRTEQPIVDGWLNTGDLGFLHAGSLTLTGRKKDLLILHGRNHAPQDAERAVDGVPGVRTGCSAAVADLSEGKERLLIFVEVREPHEGQAEACARAVLAATGLRADLVHLLAPGSLPRTSSGKIRRSETLSRWQAGTLTPPDQVTPLRMAGVLARSLLGYLGPANREA